jgi:hypothetical protein
MPQCSMVRCSINILQLASVNTVSLYRLKTSTLAGGHVQTYLSFRPQNILKASKFQVSTLSPTFIRSWRMHTIWKPSSNDTELTSKMLLQPVGFCSLACIGRINLILGSRSMILKSIKIHSFTVHYSMLYGGDHPTPARPIPYHLWHPTWPLHRCSPSVPQSISSI